MSKAEPRSISARNDATKDRNRKCRERNHVTTMVIGFAAFVGARAIPAQAISSVHQAAVPRSWSLSPGFAPPVTAADLIGMTTFGSQVQGYGLEDEHVLSPDGAHVAVVVKRGNLELNTVAFALLVFPTADLLWATKPDTVVTLSSSSNRPGIERVRWLADNTTLAFLGERPLERPQVYTVDARSRTLTAHTNAPTVITAFDIASAGEPIIYTAEEPSDTTPYAGMRSHGFVFTPKAFVGDVIAGDWLPPTPKWMRRPRVLHVVRHGADRSLPLPDSAAGYVDCRPRSLSVAPSGDIALLMCTPRAAPAAWVGYQEKRFRSEADRGYTAAEWLVLDLATGQVHPLTGAPVSDFTHFTWAPDGRSAVMTNALLPLTGADSAARALHKMVAEVDVHTGAVTVLVPRDSLIVREWNPRTRIVELVPGLYEPANTGNTAPLFFQKTPHGWRVAPLGVPGAATVPAIRIDQGLNTPPRLVAVDSRTQAKHLVYDPNPGLLTARRFGREDVLHWVTRSGDTRVGGLYWPPDYEPGQHYPLVIQTHGFDSTAFWPYGVFSTGEAAQPLANAGIIVLQIDDPPREVWATPREAPSFRESVEGAIDHLDSLGIIDRTKVGLQGFSRAQFYCLYFLTQSSYPIAAAELTDGVDFSYLQYLIYAPLNRDLRLSDAELANGGGPPFGATLAEWLKRAPGFNLNHVTTPLRFTALGSASLLTEWEAYAGLLLQEKPAELVYIPDGAHILIKPWERLASQQGAVDWYRFWLKGEGDPDPAKGEQYARWRELRKLQKQQTADTGATRQ
jgi:hypothetical protein